MKRILFVVSICVLLSSGVVAQTAPFPSSTQLKVGDMAPDFTLPNTAGKQVKLSDFRGKNNVVLAFYVFAFTGG